MRTRLVHHLLFSVGLGLALLGPATPARAESPAAVTARRTDVTLDWSEGQPIYKSNPRKNSANYIDASTKKSLGPRKFQAVELENEYLRVTVMPEMAGFIYDAVDKSSGRRLFKTPQRAADNHFLGWLSGVKASFPYREHGIRPDQPTSYRIVEHGDGAVSVAMWMEFSRFDGPWNQKMYGRNSNMFLTQRVTLRPDEALCRVAYRIINPAPYRQGRQFWNVATFPRIDSTDGRDDAEWIFPAAHVSSHRGQDFRAYTSGELPLVNLQKPYTSVFGWAMPYGFAGLYYPSVDVNRLGLGDPRRAPGAKQFYGHQSNPGGGVELFMGTDSIFEQVGHWIDPGESYPLEVAYGLATQIGRVDYANKRVAVHADFGGEEPQVAAVAWRPVESLQLKLDGQPVGEAQPCGPLTPATFSLPRSLSKARVVLVAGSEVLVDQVFPLTVKPDEKAYAVIRKTLEDIPENHEREGNCGKYRNALGRYPEDTTARGRLEYRDGRIEQAIATLRTAVENDPTDGEASHLLGIALLEVGQVDEARRSLTRAVAARRPYPPARYFLALDALASDNRAAAVRQLTTLVNDRPEHWEGRLLLAYLEGTEEKSKAVSALRSESLAVEEPADPRVQYVLAKARAAHGDRTGAAEADRAYTALLKEPGTPARMALFRAAVGGEFQHPRRMQRP